MEQKWYANILMSIFPSLMEAEAISTNIYISRVYICIIQNGPFESSLEEKYSERKQWATTYFTSFTSCTCAHYAWESFHVYGIC
jgi:hypothetical protein